MIKTSIIGFPHIGEQRELKKILESYYRGGISAEECMHAADKLKDKHLQLMKDHKIDFIPSNDFSLYDRVLDHAVMLNMVPLRFRDTWLDDVQTYFAMARGYQEARIDLKPLDMKKWFTTNYHYVVPEIEDGMEIKLVANRPLNEFRAALKKGIQTMPVLIGPYTLCKLLKNRSTKKDPFFFIDITAAYEQILGSLGQETCEWVQFDEPSLVMDMNREDRRLFLNIYKKLLSCITRCNVLLQTCFGDVRDVYDDIMSLPFEAVGLDFVDGEKNVELISGRGFPGDRLLFAGVMSGHNVWVNDYKKSLGLLNRLSAHVGSDHMVINTSCSLLHVPFSTSHEKKMARKHREQLSFAVEKLDELREIAFLFEEGGHDGNRIYIRNQEIINNRKKKGLTFRNYISKKINKLTEKDFSRQVPFYERERIQSKVLSLPDFPTSTIGSFPQTEEVRKIRADFRNKRIPEYEYTEAIMGFIDDLIILQEKIGLDVFVHGEFERNDMVEYFGENLEGFVHTENGWVQSYGSRCVKPPIIIGDVYRKKPMTVHWIRYAQSLTDKPVKGMLTGPVTILNWSFPREDIPRSEIAFQIALAIQEEVLDLEKSGAKIIQIDEAALREKLPLRKSEWRQVYLDWAVKAFRLASSKVKPETQIQTHMCYSEFSDIMDSIIEMDADVILIEAAKSNLSILESFQLWEYKAHVGPGVYDIHSPRIPAEDEIFSILKDMVYYIHPNKLWVNPDCGLKTRKFEETVPSLMNMVRAAKRMRAYVGGSGV